MMKNFNWSKYSKPIILVAFIVVLSILRPKAFLSLDNFSNVLWSVAVIGIMVSGTIFVFLIGGIDLSIATLCAFSAVIAVTVTHNMGDTPGAVFAGVFAALIAGALAGAVHGIVLDDGIPGKIQPRGAASDAHRAAGRAREAEDAYRRAREFPVRARLAPEAALRLGQLLLARGAAEESVPCFRDAVSLCATEELQPLRIWAYEGLGHAALRLGDRESAVRYLMTVGILYDDPKLVPPVLLEAARLLDELGRAEEAADVRATLRRDFPDSEAARSLGE